MATPTLVEPRSSGWPWWMDPYSDNPIAFGLLFLLIIVGMIGGMLLFRFLFVHSPGASPIGPGFCSAHALLRSFLGAR